MMFHDPATPQFYTLSLHDALPISRGRIRTRRPDGRRPPERAARHRRRRQRGLPPRRLADVGGDQRGDRVVDLDRKSTRLNSSHSQISYAVFCLKKKKKKKKDTTDI